MVLVSSTGQHPGAKEWKQEVLQLTITFDELPEDFVFPSSTILGSTELEDLVLKEDPHQEI